MTEVAAAIIKNKKGEILICRRGPGGNCAGLWEFPGGKIEPGETAEACVLRECREELDVEIVLGECYAKTHYAYPDREIAFTFFRAAIVQGTPKMLVHTAIDWSPKDRLLSYDFCPADTEILRRLAAE